MEAESDLFEVIGAGRPSCRFADHLDRWESQTHQNPDDRDYHQQLDQSKPLFLARSAHGNTSDIFQFKTKTAI